MTLLAPDITFLRETMEEGELIKKSLESLLPGWSFLALDGVKGV